MKLLEVASESTSQYVSSFVRCSNLCLLLESMSSRPAYSTQHYLFLLVFGFVFLRQGFSITALAAWKSGFQLTGTSLPLLP